MKIEDLDYKYNKNIFYKVKEDDNIEKICDYFKITKSILFEYNLENNVNRKNTIIFIPKTNINDNQSLNNILNEKNMKEHFIKRNIYNKILKID